MTKVVIVGAGALGSHLVQFARNLPVELTVIDFDRVEAKNVLAQFHSRMGLGRNKAQALQQAMQGLFGTKLASVPHKLADGNADQLLGRADVVVDCLDNAASRRVVQELARARGVPCLHGALSADGAFGRVVWDEHFTIDSEDVEGQATCEGGDHLPFIGLTGSLLAQALKDFVTDGRKVGFYVGPGNVTRL